MVPEMGVGKVLAVLKTRAKIKFLRDHNGWSLEKSDQIFTYGRSHYQFLDKVK